MRSLATCSNHHWANIISISLASTQRRKQGTVQDNLTLPLSVKCDECLPRGSSIVWCEGKQQQLLALQVTELCLDTYRLIHYQRRLMEGIH